MESMIERVAMALAAKYHGTAKVTPQYVFGEATGGRVFVEMAIAAIEALRDPTEAMEDAGEKAIYDLPRHIAVMAYEAMIEAALKEHES